jgi:hypothetical protein
MLFNLTTQTSFPCKDPSRAILCSDDRGPFFGDVELSACEPFNQRNSVFTHTNNTIYKIPRNSEGINMLTNQYSK